MAVDSKDQVLTLLREHQAELRQLGVERCGVFGSFARGDTQDQSDVDILVEFRPGQNSFDNFMQLATLLEELFGRKGALNNRLPEFVQCLMGRIV